MRRRRQNNSSTDYGRGWRLWLVVAGMLALGLLSLLLAAWRRLLMAVRASLLWFRRQLH